eukprot:5938617-Karenia_brevis.AAC.1
MGKYDKRNASWGSAQHIFEFITIRCLCMMSRIYTRLSNIIFALVLILVLLMPGPWGSLPVRMCATIHVLQYILAQVHQLQHLAEDGTVKVPTEGKDAWIKSQSTPLLLKALRADWSIEKS